MRQTSYEAETGQPIRALPETKHLSLGSAEVNQRLPRLPLSANSEGSDYTRVGCDALMLQELDSGQHNSQASRNFVDEGAHRI
jgi:hypothetical protein